MLNFWQIQFPIFPIAKEHCIQTIDNCLIVEDLEGNHRVLDNMSMPGETLGLRRLQHQASVDIFSKKLFKLSKPLYSIIDILHTTASKFIDSKGKIFNYTKSKFFKLESFKIQEFIEVSEGYIIKVHGIHCSFFLNRAPHVDEKFARVLRVGMGYLLYELEREYRKPSRLKL